MKARHEFQGTGINGGESAYRDYLRHYYAGEAMKAMMSINTPTLNDAGVAIDAVNVADDLIAALDAPKEQK